jgi:hypothetical protein
MTTAVNNEGNNSMIFHVKRVSFTLIILSIISSTVFYVQGYIRLKAAFFLLIGSALTNAESLILVLLWFFLGVLAAAGLSLHQKWARTVAIGISALYLVFFPVGTVFGVYALWVLFSQDSMKLFNML